MRNLFNKKRISRLITIGFLAVFLWYAVTNTEIFQSFKTISILSLCLIILGRFVVYFSNGLFTKWSIELFTKKISIGEGIYIGILSAIGNFFGPLLGGAGIRAVYLKKIHGLTYSKFTSTLVGYYIILFTLNGIISIIALAMIPSSSQSKVLVLFFSAWLLAIILLSKARIPTSIKERYNNRLLKFIIKVAVDIEDGWRQILGNKKLMKKLILVAITSYMGSLIMFSAEFTALGVPLHLSSLLLYTSFVTISLLISVTPGAIGIRETILLLTAATLGITVPEILKLAVLDRAINFSLLFIMFILLRSRKLKKVLTKREIEV